MLTPSAGKHLIGMAVAALPQVQKAYKRGRLAVANGTTTGYVIEALTGKPVEKFAYRVGVVTDGIFAENPDSDHTLKMWENGREMDVPFPEFLKELHKYERNDVFIKGANAVDPYGFAGGLQTNPAGGSWAAAFVGDHRPGNSPYCTSRIGKNGPFRCGSLKKMGQL